MHALDQKKKSESLRVLYRRRLLFFFLWGRGGRAIKGVSPPKWDLDKGSWLFTGKFFSFPRVRDAVGKIE